MMKPHPSNQPGDTVCPNCGGSVEVRNPTGECDHLYFPDMLTDEAKAKIGEAELARIHAECMRNVAKGLQTRRTA
jgi:hypothetical protein